jgi:hypothetical protein
MSSTELDMINRGGSTSRSGDLVCGCGMHYVVGMATGGKGPSVCVLGKSK